METSVTKTSFSGSLSAYWGLSMITAFSGILTYAFDSSILFGITALFGVGTVYGYLFDRFRKVMLREEQLIAFRGFFRTKKFDLNEATLTVAKERGDAGIPLIDLDIDGITDWKAYKYLQVRLPNKEKPVMEIFENDFEEEEFKAMLKGVKYYSIENCGTPLQKATFAHKKTLSYLEADKKLRNELMDTLNDAYRSVYQPFETLLSKSVIEELKQDSDVLFQAIKQGNVLMYYRRNRFQEGAGSESIRIAENLIAATRENLEVVETRLASHQEVKTRLDKLIGQRQHEQRLTDVASKLDELQQKNVHQSINMDDVAHDTEIIQQIQELTEQINRTETIEKSLVLREHIQMINHKDEEGIKQLNKRLERE